MCGIVGAVSHQTDIVPFLFSGLSALEYRGYDSAGLAVLTSQEEGAASASQDSSIVRCRTSGRVIELITKATTQKVHGYCGIAHTRWATHGEPSQSNAHPHMSGNIAIVHNGIIENHWAIKKKLQAKGFLLTSNTDSEVIAHLVAFYYQSKDASLLEAVQLASETLEGIYTFVAMASDAGHELIGISQGAPLVVGTVADQAHYLASDLGALVPVTEKTYRLISGDTVRITSTSCEFFDAKRQTVQRPQKAMEASRVVTTLGDYDHYMQKEIFEQPLALAETIEYYGSDISDLVSALDTKLTLQSLKTIEHVIIVACGTSYHAGLTAQYWLEALSGLPCRVDIASEFRYRPVVISPHTLVIAISQSGETADTISAINYAKQHQPSLTMCITNVSHSAIVESVFAPLLTHAGPEIGVASTKAFTTQLAVLGVLSIALGHSRGVLSDEAAKEHLKHLQHVPQSVEAILKKKTDIQTMATAFIENQHALFLGRGIHYPIALEGALKLKEISYIHAEAYPSGELKHGPLALVDKNMPVIAVAPDDSLLSKLLSNLEEVRARGGRLYVFSESDIPSSHTQFTSADQNIVLGKNTVGVFSPIVNVIPLQLLSYYVAVLRGTDVDHPRNLAKSVTVE